MSLKVYDQIMVNKESYFYRHNNKVIRITFDTSEMAQNAEPAFFDWLTAKKDYPYIILSRYHFAEWFSLLWGD